MMLAFVLAALMGASDPATADSPAFRCASAHPPLVPGTPNGPELHIVSCDGREWTRRERQRIAEELGRVIRLCADSTAEEPYVTCLRRGAQGVANLVGNARAYVIVASANQ